MSNSSLVFLSEDHTVPLTSSEVIATALEKDHKDVLYLAKKYQPDLNEFGSSSFKTKLITAGKGAKREKEIALLNEQQATLLITYMRNSEKVRRFKIALVRAFFELREKLQKQKYERLLDQAYQRGLLEGKKKNSVKINPDDLNCALKTLSWLNSNREDFRAGYDHVREIMKHLEELKETLVLLGENLEISSRIGEDEVRKILNQMKSGR